MAVNIQLKSFTAKTSPVPADIMYLGDSASSFDEVKSTIAQVIGAYPALLSIGGLTTAANEYIYTTGVDTYAVHAITATPTANILAAWDTNSNLSANNFLPGLTVIVSAAGTTTLTVASNYYQLVNGSTTQTIVLPVVATLVKGQSYYIMNTSSGVVTVQSSGANTVQAMAANTAMLVTFNNTAGTAAASWTVTHYGSSGLVLPLSIANGGTGVTSVTTTPTASAWSGWDANSNQAANNFLTGYATTATAAGTTTLTVASAGIQEFTGATTQTIVMPVVSTLVLGQAFKIINSSTGVLTVNSSGANLITTIPAGNTLYITCILITGTAAASWSATLAASAPYSQSIAWTPVLSFATPGDVSVSYAIQTGRYSKIGNIVSAHFVLTCTPTFTTASGNLQISGLPFAVNSSVFGFGGLLFQAPTYPAGTSAPFIQAVNSQTYFVIGANGSAAAAAYFTTVQCLTGVPLTIQGSINYITT